MRIFLWALIVLSIGFVGLKNVFFFNQNFLLKENQINLQVHCCNPRFFLTLNLWTQAIDYLIKKYEKTHIDYRSHLFIQTFLIIIKKLFVVCVLIEGKKIINKKNTKMKKDKNS